LRLADACDLGLPGDGPCTVNLVPVGVLGADSGGGIRFDLTRMVGFEGGEVVRSIADAERAAFVAGGATARGPVIPGDAVCALGGGGGNVGLLVSAPAFLLTHRLRSLS